MRGYFQVGIQDKRKLTIDTVEIHVLDVPAEGGLPHAKVEVGQVHPWDSLLHQVHQHRVQVLDVPDLLILVREAAGHVCTVNRRHTLVVEVLLPIELLQLLIRIVRWCQILLAGCQSPIPVDINWRPRSVCDGFEGALHASHGNVLLHRLDHNVVEVGRVVA